MKAALLTAPGTPVYADIPEPATDLPLVEVLLAGMNPIDMVLATQPGAGFPRVAGSEGIGRHDGRKVYFSAVAPFGAMAERAAALPERMLPVPEDLDAALAVALGIGGLTAFLSLVDRGGLQPGETVLVLGASGIVGRIAVQLARHLGAGRVIAAARTLAAVADLDADATVSLADDDAEALAAGLRAAGPADLVIDPVWGVPALAALKSAAPGGRLVQLGHSAGASIPFAPAFMRGGGTEIRGYSSSLATAARRAEVYAMLCGLALRGVLHVPTEVVALADIAAVWARQGGSPHAKLCLQPG